MSRPCCSSSKKNAYRNGNRNEKAARSLPRLLVDCSSSTQWALLLLVALGFGLGFIELALDLGGLLEFLAVSAELLG